MIELKENIYSVGVTDSKIRIFHGYEVPFGTTYNAYLVIDDKITLVDFVKASFNDEFIKNIKEVLGDKKIDYMICNHVEPDHSGAMPELVRQYPEAIVIGTASCQKELAVYYPELKLNFQVVKAGDSISTGKFNFDFIPMPMIHWPDSMSTYLREEKILFSNDAMGQHIASGKVYDTEIGLDTFLERAGDYYANIVLPYGSQVSKLLETVSKLEIAMVCPSHGVIITEYIPVIVEKYSAWCKNIVDDQKCVIIYDTMWGTTEKLANILEEESKAKGLSVEKINLSQKHYSYAMGRILEVKYIFVGSPTLNNEMMPTVSAFLTYMKGLRPQNRCGKAFGSYGWSGESISKVSDVLVSCGFEILESLKAQWNV